MKLFLASLGATTLDLINPLLTKPTKNTRIAYIPTAADTYPGASWVKSDQEKMSQMGFLYEVYDIKNKDSTSLRQDLVQYDGIYVTGGNTFYLLDHIQRSGFDIVIKELINQGTIYIGGSAGSCIMCPTIEHVQILDHPEEVPELTDYTALGLGSELIIPHAGRDKYSARHAKLKKQYGDRLLFLRDDQALIVDGDQREIQSLL